MPLYYHFCNIPPMHHAPTTCSPPPPPQFHLKATPRFTILLLVPVSTPGPFSFYFLSRNRCLRAHSILLFSGFKQSNKHFNLFQRFLLNKSATASPTSVPIHQFCFQFLHNPSQSHDLPPIDFYPFEAHRGTVRCHLLASEQKLKEVCGRVRIRPWWPCES
jgi:hypothetical protein